MQHGPIVGALAAACIFGAYAIADQLVGVGGGVWSGRITADSDGATLSIVNDGGTTVAVPVPCGGGGAAPAVGLYTMLQIHARGAARVGIAGNTAATLNGVGWDAQASVYAAGGGNIRSFGTNGGEWHTRPNWSSLRNQPGGGTGLCVNPISAYGGFALYPSCTTNAQCTALGAGSICDTTPDATQQAAAGCFVIAERDGSEDVVVDVHAETVQR